MDSILKVPFNLDDSIITYHTLKWLSNNWNTQNCLRINVVSWEVAAGPMLILSTVPEALYYKESNIAYRNAVSLKIIPYKLCSNQS